MGVANYSVVCEGSLRQLRGRAASPVPGARVPTTKEKWMVYATRLMIRISIRTDKECSGTDRIEQRLGSDSGGSLSGLAWTAGGAQRSLAWSSALHHSGRERVVNRRFANAA